MGSLLHILREEWPALHSTPLGSMVILDCTNRDSLWIARVDPDDQYSRLAVYSKDEKPRVLGQHETLVVLR